MTARRSTAAAVALYLGASVPLRMASAGSSVVIPVLSVQRLGDVAVGGALVAASLAPSVLVAPLAGAALDRSSRPRRLFIGSGVVSALVLLLTAFLGDVPLPFVVGALILSGAVSPFFYGGLSSVVADVVPGERRAFAQDGLSYTVAGVAGPGIAAVIITVLSAQGATFVLAAAAAVGCVALAALPVTARIRGESPTSVLADIRAGFRYLFGYRPLAVVTASGTLTQLGNGALAVSAVVLALERTGDADQGAVIVTAFAVGGLLGSVLTTFAASVRVAPVVVMGVGFLLTGLATLGVLPPWGVIGAVVAVGVSGFFSAPATSAMLLLRKHHSPAAVRSQVFAVGSGLRVTVAAAGAALAGVFSALPAGVLFGAIAVSWMASAALALLFPRGAPIFDD